MPGVEEGPAATFRPKHVDKGFVTLQRATARTHTLVHVFVVQLELFELYYVRRYLHIRSTGDGTQFILGTGLTSRSVFSNVHSTTGY